MAAHGSRSLFFTAEALTGAFRKSGKSLYCTKSKTSLDLLQRWKTHGKCNAKGLSHIMQGNLALNSNSASIKFTTAYYSTAAAGFHSGLKESYKHSQNDDRLNLLSEKGVTYTNSHMVSSDYIGQPTPATHPHLMDKGEATVIFSSIRLFHANHTKFSTVSGKSMTSNGPQYLRTIIETQGFKGQSDKAPFMIELKKPSPPDLYPTPRPARRGTPIDAFVTPGITKKEYKDRRHKLMSLLHNTHFGEEHDKHVIIIPGNANKFMTTDVPYPFRQNSDFLYLTGFQEPDAVLILETKDGLSLPYHHSILFVKPRDPRKELWEGSRAGVKGAIEFFGADEAYSINNLSSTLLQRYAKKGYCIWYDHLRPTHPVLHGEISKMLFNNPAFTFTRLLSLGHNIHMLRLIKSPAEVELIRKSASVASKAIAKAMRSTRPGLEESHLHTILEYECRMLGAERLAYPPVVAGGSLANTLHYINNTQLLRDGDLVLLDAGCEYHGYASDITRTWPVNGTFTKAQRQLYDIVLRVQKKSLALCQRDITLDYLHHAMLVFLGQELTREGVLPKNLTEAQAKKAASELCPHHIGHYLGMDTHDTHLVSRGLGLQPGMVVTVEPGLYIPSHAHDIPARYHGIGIRIEDDILITENGQEILSAECPKEPGDIENHMKQ